MSEAKEESGQQDAYDYKRLHSYPLIRVSRIFVNLDMLDWEYQVQVSFVMEIANLFTLLPLQMSLIGGFIMFYLPLLYTFLCIYNFIVL